MALNLNIPLLHDNPTIIAETDPVRINHALEILRNKTPLTLATHLHGELALLNRQKLSPNNRIQALDVYRAALMNTASALAEDYSSVALPLHDQAKLAASAAESLWLELGYGYKLALVDLQNQFIKLGTNKSSARAIQRAMHAIAEFALVHYQTYVSPPEHIWRDLHQLYLCATQLGLDQTEIVAEAANATQATTVENTYKHALLMSLADPQHLTQRNIRLTAEYLAFHVSGATLTALTPLEVTTSCFIVNLSTSKPPIAYSKQTIAGNPDTDLILHTLDFVINIHQDLNTLKTQQLPKDGGIPAKANIDEYIDLLTYLIKHWGLTQKRNFNRMQTNSEIEVFSGLSAICQASNQADIKPNSLTTPPAIQPSRWHVLNMSAVGMSVRHHPSAEKNIYIGGLMGFKSKEERHWSLGLVRWANCDNKDKLDIGVQILAPRIQSVMVNIDNSKHRELALLLPEIVAGKQLASIIARVGTYKAARQISITYHGHTHLIMLTTLVERSHLFERIQYNVIN